MRVTAAAFLSLGLIASASGQDFDGFYAGVYSGTTIAGDNGIYQAGAIVGGRAETEQHFILGGEARLGGGFNNGTYLQAEGFAEGQAGVALGGNVAVYGSLGAGYLFLKPLGSPTGFSNLYLTAGAGVEFAPNDLVRLRGEVRQLVNPRFVELPYTQLNAAALLSFD